MPAIFPNPEALWTLLSPVAEQALHRFQPPVWLVQALQQRLVLFLNHVLKQDSVAQQRLRQHANKQLRLQWQHFSLLLRITPVGLLDLPGTDSDGAVLSANDPMNGPMNGSINGPLDLDLEILTNSPQDWLEWARKGKRPQVRIQGDVQLAAEVAWLGEHVRWDYPEDLARVLGETQAQTVIGLAHFVCQAIREGLNALQSTADKLRPEPTPSPSFSARGSE